MKVCVLLAVLLTLGESLPALPVEPTIPKDSVEGGEVTRDKRKLSSDEEVNVIENGDDNDILERSKKQAFLVAMPKSKKNCDMEEIDNDAPKSGMPMFVQPSPERMAKTYEPIYSYGPINLMGANGYGSNIRPQFAPTADRQFALAPYAFLHQHPMFHHTSVAINRSPSKLEQVVYDVPEPIYVVDTAVQETKQPALYCHPIADDALKPIGKTNLTDPEDHIKKVNEIRSEIMQLNQAAQRIVQQQEELGRMQREHNSKGQSKSSASAASASSAGYYQSPYPYNSYYQPYRSVEMEERAYQPPPYGHYPHHFPRPPYGGYYGRSTEELPKMSDSKANAANFPASPEDIELFTKMMEMGKKMGLLSSNFKAAEPSTPKPIHNEELLGDLVKGKDKSEEVKPVTTSAPGKQRDQRGLVFKLNNH